MPTFIPSVETIEILHNFPFIGIVCLVLMVVGIYAYVRKQLLSHSKFYKVIVLAGAIISITIVFLSLVDKTALYLLKKPYLAFSAQGMRYQPYIRQSCFFKWDDIEKISVHKQRFRKGRRKLFHFYSDWLKSKENYYIKVFFLDGGTQEINLRGYNIDMMFAILIKYVCPDKLIRHKERFREKLQIITR